MYICKRIIQLYFYDFPIGFSSLNVCDLDFASTILVLLPGMNHPQAMLGTSVTKGHRLLTHVMIICINDVHVTNIFFGKFSLKIRFFKIY